MMSQKPQAQVGARVVELAFLYGSLSDVLQVIGCLKESGCPFFDHISKNLRSYLVVKLAAQKQYELLSFYLFPLRNLRSLLPVEKLVIYRLLVIREEFDQAAIHLRQCENDIHRAVIQFGLALQLDVGEFYYEAGKGLAEAQLDNSALSMFEKIPHDHKCHSLARECLMDLQIEFDENGLTYYGRQLKKVDSWRQRLSLFCDFLSSCRLHRNQFDRHRPALNELLLDPLQWFPKLPEAWKRLSELIVNNGDLEEIVPNIFRVFEKQAVHFDSPTLDTAFWHPVEALASGDEFRDCYWRAVAFLHRFVVTGPEGEVFLWRSQTLLDNLRSQHASLSPFSWEYLHRAATLWVSKNPNFTEKTRNLKSRQLRIAANPSQLAGVDVVDYLSASEPPYSVLERLLRIAHWNKNFQLVKKITDKKSESFGLTNSNLGILYNAALQTKDFDLCWRICTVLKSRTSLKKPFENVWSVSGEKRGEYQFFLGSRSIAEATLPGKTTDERKFLQSLLRVGHAVPYLLFAFNFLPKMDKFSFPSRESIFHQVMMCTKQVDWLIPPKHSFLFSFSDQPHAYRVLPFAPVMVNNIWSYTWLQVSNCLGISAWNWQVEWLRKRVNELVPRFTQREDRRFMMKMSKWLRSLPAGDKGYWYELIASQRRLKDERCEELIMEMTARIALLLYQNHVQALNTIQKMRLPLGFLRKIEGWILSEQYSLTRNSLGIQSRVPVPQHLQQLNTPVSVPVDC